MTDFSEVLSHYGVRGQVVAEHDGPLLRQIEFLPEAGSKIKNIEAVVDDMARELGVNSLRVDYIDGTNHLGFELPKKEMKSVDFDALMQQAGHAAGCLPICLGADVRGNPVFADLAKMPHLLVGGTTGSGKSVGLNTFILSLMAAKRPAELKFVLIDPKRIEFGIYNHQKYMLCPVVTETDDAVQTISYLVAEMERRYDVLEQSGCKSIGDYNEQTEGKLMPYIVCVIDEFADLTAADKSVEKNVQRLAQKARACGIHLILATQRPSVDVVTGVLKANFPTRLAYKVASHADSRTILDAGGAEKLLGRGDALFLASDGQLKRIHGAYVADGQIKSKLEPYRAEVKPLPRQEKQLQAAPAAKVQKKTDGWLAKIWKFWTSLRQKDKKLIISAAIYVFNKATNNSSRRKR